MLLPTENTKFDKFCLAKICLVQVLITSHGT